MKSIKNKIILTLSVLLAAVTGYSLYESFNGEMSKAEIQTQFSDLKTDYEFMQKDLENSMNSLDKSNTVVQAQQRKIKILLAKNSISEEELMEAKKIMRSISKEVLNEYQKRIENLEAEKRNLLVDLDNDKTKLNNLDHQFDKIKKEKREITTKLTRERSISEKKDELLNHASKLSLSNFILRSYKVKSSGREIETDKASRINKVKMTFDINTNLVAPSGNRELFIVVYKPDGNIAHFDNRPTGSFMSGNRNLIYSDKMVIPYTRGKERNVEMIWDNHEFKKGDYIIEVFEKMQTDIVLIGKTTKNLE